MAVSVTINIDDESRFNKVITEQLDALKPEEIKDIITNAIKEMLHEDDNKILKNILVKEHRNVYNGYTTYEASDLLKHILESFDYSAGQDLVDDLVKDLRENNKSIIEDIMLNLLIKGITNNTAFYEEMKDILRQIHNGY